MSSDNIAGLGEVLRLTSLKPELQEIITLVSCLICRRHVGYSCEFGTESDDGLTQHLWLLRLRSMRDAQTFIPSVNPGSNPPSAGRLIRFRYLQPWIYGNSTPARLRFL